MPIAESTGWYWPDGRPCLEVPSADGKRMVEPTVKHARALPLYCSVTKVLKIKANPGLVQWMKKEERVAAWSLLGPDSDREFPDFDSFDEDCSKLASEVGRKAADEGKAIHAGVEAILRGEQPGADVERFARPVADCLLDMAPDWQPELCLVHPTLKYAGRCDIFSPSLGLIFDIKTRRFESQAASYKIKPYDEESMQLAAYAEALRINGKIVHAAHTLYVSRDVPGLFTVYTDHDIPPAWECFEALLKVFKVVNRLEGK